MTSFVDLDAGDIVQSCNSIAGVTLGCKSPIGRPFSDLLSDAAKFGFMSKLAVGRIMACPQAGSTTFHMEDGRTFLLQSQALEHGARRIEWMDISAALVEAEDRDLTTGLLSRKGFLEVLGRVSAESSPLLAYILEIDNFADVTDRFGSEVADHLVRRTAERISAQAGGKEVHLAYCTGGQFRLISTQEVVAPLVDALLEILGRPHLVDGKMVYSTVSIGIAQVNDADAEAVLRNAAMALKQAKAEGGNQAVVFTTQMQQAVYRKRMLETELRKALALREFSLVYQPQFQVHGRSLIGFEALLRWNHPEQGPISPAEFIPLAEELGLIVPIGEWVLKTACRKAASWPEEISISVNISPLQFRSPAIVSTVSAALDSSGLDPNRLDLEVTEGAVLMNSSSVMNTFSQLKAIGVRFSMDDFGTGYSSLSYLQKFPFDKIKIDQSFVRSIAASPDSLSIIRAICALGKTLGLTTIAEGVETEEQFAQIQKKGCQQVQGYLTGKPLSAELADQIVAASSRSTERKL
ncbi:putative bifunctional diguanylate cyclase/phosphodiesterase [Rhizobium wenxiniae]|uniref:putative bifunctional diguanylate cyclase/phosphodiesterase n=1 Tax=Rhizobium wenxiniae TaxID=1737357 RepID=UPI003C1F6869